MAGWKEKDSEGLGAFEDIYIYTRARARTHMVGRRVGRRRVQKPCVRIPERNTCKL